MIVTSSRYTPKAETRNGNTVIVATRLKTATPNYLVHRAKYGESFQSLASRYLGSPLFYWKIADLNPHVPFPDFIEEGTSIRIPQ